MRVRTYNPLPAWIPSAFCAAILVAAHVVGPLIARVLNAVDPANTDYPSTD